jgi:hypothetical protein
MSDHYIRRWIDCHAGEVDQLCREFGLTLAVVRAQVPPRAPTPFLFCARLLIGTELGYREIEARAQREGFTATTVNSVRSYASRLRWFGIHVSQRNGWTGYRSKKK